MENQNKSEIMNQKAHDVWICLFVLFLLSEAMKTDTKAEEEKCSCLL